MSMDDPYFPDRRGLPDWLTAMVFCQELSQDAPALGYMPSVYARFVTTPDTTPPKVGAADPIADIVRMYRLVLDHPEYRPTFPPDGTTGDMRGDLP